MVKIFVFFGEGREKEQKGGKEGRREKGKENENNF